VIRLEGRNGTPGERVAGGRRAAARAAPAAAGPRNLDNKTQPITNKSLKLPLAFSFSVSHRPFSARFHR